MDRPGHRIRILTIGLAVMLAAAAAACEDDGGPATTTPPTTVAPSTTAAPTTSTTTLPATTTTTTEPDPVVRTAAVVEGFAAAWAAEDPDALSAFYADGVRSYDATAGGAAYNKSTIDSVLHGMWVRGAFEVALTSYFVSSDGRFAATLGTFSEQDESGNLVAKPYASLLAFEDDQIVWVYDYYGGAMSPTEPMPTIPLSTVEPGSPEARTAIAEATATIEQWIAAYNNRDGETYLTFYADEARYVDVVSPDSRVMTKDELAADIASHFPRAKFESRLEPSFGSVVDSFFVSADGRFAAVQGAYEDEGTIIAKPMVVILELQAGKIVQQHNFIVIERDLLQP